jgi:hypothetical protein
MTKWMSRIAVIGTTAVLGFTLTGIANAEPSNEPAPITLSPEKVKKICEVRVPRIEARIAKATERINGGPEAKGSTQWLKAQAQKATDAGKTDRAKLLNDRATVNADRLVTLDNSKKRVEKFKSDHCNYTGATK